MREWRSASVELEHCYTNRMYESQGQFLTLDELQELSVLTLQKFATKRHVIRKTRVGALTGSHSLGQ